MSIQNGEKIVLEFSEELIGDVTGEVGSFSVSFPERRYEPEGELITSTRTPIAVERHKAELTTSVDMESGDYNGTVYERGVLTLDYTVE